MISEVIIINCTSRNASLYCND